MTDASDAQAIVDIALRAADPSPLIHDDRYAVVVPEGGRVEIIDPTPDSLRANPRRRVGSTTVFDAPSLVQLWHKYAGDHSELYADPIAFRIVAVFDADSVEDAGHRQHRAELVCRKTVAWEAWLHRDGQLLDQTTFAQFLEDRLIDIVEPAAAAMLELASTFQASTNVEFKSATILSSSQRSLQYEETTTAKAGQKGDIEIPATFAVALQPFEGSDAYRVVARFRYKITHGQLAIGYRLERPEDVLRTAFEDVQSKVAEDTETSILLGTPARER